MKTSRMMAMAAVATSVFLGTTDALRAAGETGEDANIGKPAPVLNVKEWAVGKGLTQADLKDKAYVLEFWATWCPPCRKSIPHLVDLAQRVMPLDMPIIGLSDEDIAKIRPFAEKNTMLYLVGANGGTTGLKFSGIPFAAVISKEGKIAWAGHPMDPEFEKNIYQAAEAARPEWKPLFALAREGKIGAMRAELAKGTTQAHKDGVAVIDAFVARLMEAGEKEKGLAQVKICKEVATRYAGMPVAEQAAKKAEELAKDPAIAAQFADEDAAAGLDKSVSALRTTIMEKQNSGTPEAECRKLFFHGLKDIFTAFVKEHPKHPQVPQLQKALEEVSGELSKMGSDKPAPTAPAAPPRK